MISKKTLLIFVILLFFISNFSVAVMCARLQGVSGGEYHTLALMEDNTLWGCGSNDFSQLGIGSDVSDAYSLDQVLGENGIGYLQNVVTFDAGWYHSLAADINGVCYSWGMDNYGQLGNGSSEWDWDVPQKVNGYGDLGANTQIVYVSAGRSGKHSLVVDSNGYVYGFGLNDEDQCGSDTGYFQEDSPVLVVDDDPQTTDFHLGNIATIIKVDAGAKHSLALDDEGYVFVDFVCRGGGYNAIILEMEASGSMRLFTAALEVFQ